jgi:hypothetical protein
MCFLLTIFFQFSSEFNARQESWQEMQEMVREEIRWDEKNRDEKDALPLSEDDKIRRHDKNKVSSMRPPRGQKL